MERRASPPGHLEAGRASLCRNRAAAENVAGDHSPKPRRFWKILSRPRFRDFPGKSMNKLGK